MNSLEAAINAANEIANKKMNHRKSKSVDCGSLNKAFEKFNAQANEKRGIDRINEIIQANEKLFALQKQDLNSQKISKVTPRRKAAAEVNFNDLLESLDAIATEVKVKKGKREEKAEIKPEVKPEVKQEVKQEEKQEEIEDVDDKPNPPIKQHSINYSGNFKSLIDFGKKISNESLVFGKNTSNSNEENGVSGITDLINNSKSYLLNLAKKANDTIEEIKTKEKDNNNEEKVSDKSNENEEIEEQNIDNKVISYSRKSSDATICRSDNDQCESIPFSPKNKTTTTAPIVASATTSDSDANKEDEEMKRSDTIKKFQSLALPELPVNKNSEGLPNSQTEEQNVDKNGMRYSKSPSMAFSKNQSSPSNRHSKINKKQSSPSIRHSRIGKDQSSPAVRYVKVNKDQQSPVVRYVKMDKSSPANSYTKMSNEQTTPKMSNSQSSPSLHSEINNDQSSPSIHSLLANNDQPSYTKMSNIPPSPSLHYFNKIKEQTSPSTHYSKMNNDQSSPSLNNKSSPSLQYANANQSTSFANQSSSYINQSSSSLYLPNPVRKDSMRYSYSHALNNYSNDESTNNKRKSFLNQKRNTSNGLRKKISQNRLSQNRSSINFTDYQNIQELSKYLNNTNKNLTSIEESNNNNNSNGLEKINVNEEKPAGSPEKKLDSPGHEEDLLGLMTSNIEKDKTLERMMDKLEAMKNKINDESKPQSKDPSHFCSSPNWAKRNVKTNSYPSNNESNSRSSLSSYSTSHSSQEDKRINNDDFMAKRKQYHSVVLPSNRNSSLSSFSNMSPRNHHTSIQPNAMKSKYFRYSVARNINTYNNPGSIPVPSHRTKLTVPHFDPQQQLNKGNYYSMNINMNMNMTEGAIYEESNNNNNNRISSPRGFYFRDINEKTKNGRISNIVSDIKDEDRSSDSDYDYRRSQSNLQQFQFTNKMDDVDRMNRPVHPVPPVPYNKEQEQWKLNMHTVTLYDEENPKPKKKHLKKRFSFFRKSNKTSKN